MTYAWATSAVTVDLRLNVPQNTGAGGIDTLTNIENVTGGSGNDSLIGNAQGNRLDGLGGQRYPDRRQRQRCLRGVQLRGRGQRDKHPGHGDRYRPVLGDLDAWRQPGEPDPVRAGRH